MSSIISRCYLVLISTPEGQATDIYFPFKEDTSIYGGVLLDLLDKYKRDELAHKLKEGLSFSDSEYDEHITHCLGIPLVRTPFAISSTHAEADHPHKLLSPVEVRAFINQVYPLLHIYDSEAAVSEHLPGMDRDTFMEVAYNMEPLSDAHEYNSRYPTGEKLLFELIM